MQEERINSWALALSNLQSIALDESKSSDERMDAIRTIYTDFDNIEGANALFEIASKGVTVAERKAAMWRAKSLKDML